MMKKTNNKNLVRSSAFLSGSLMSLCCGVPLVLAVVGSASLGFLNSFIGEYHWLLILGASVLISGSWYLYIRERKNCMDAEGSCNVDVNSTSNIITKYILIFSSVVVVSFGALNIYSLIKDGNSKQFYAEHKGVVTEIKVAGMTCASCELHVEGALKKLDGVYNAKASTSKENVIVDYDATKLSRKDLMSAINATGYKALERSKS